MKRRQTRRVFRVHALHAHFEEALRATSLAAEDGAAIGNIKLLQNRIFERKRNFVLRSAVKRDHLNRVRQESYDRANAGDLFRSGNPMNAVDEQSL